MRFAIFTISAVVALFGCHGSSTESNSNSWAGGTWVAVRMNGMPLPYQSGDQFPYTQTDSLIIHVLEWASPPSVSVFPYVNSYYSPGETRPIICAEGFGNGTITGTSLTIRANGPRTSIGDCGLIWVNMNLSRMGDSLAGMWQNTIDVRFVKR